MRHISLNVPGLGGLALLVGLGAWGGVGVSTALGQTSHSGCYAEDENGQLYDLGALCTAPRQRRIQVEPVLQTGDVQVTLRWNTEDDLDLLVFDPTGNAIDFASPTSPSGGKLDVDANGFCETQAFSPVENIFWPTGGAPGGDYVAYVNFAIPCTLEALAISDAAAAETAYGVLEVPYILTILVEGVTTTYEGISKPEEISVEYPFRVGPPVTSTGDTVSVTALSEDGFEVPNFGQPEL
ncbi:hypothetical protein [Leptothoe sp. PORK10 BA2]|uniref:hypothetical protein n=1 Tax=Leptothoe sp. PORK10 BA2 TaxID=3110254 RepID=UPI002B204247|nr:hypothetical protein [Leptothoe sp. PORK10 BA2]MEA5462328.1 hypothetical protein [Leptothoe sp. PORK10 BA2]